MQAKFFREIKNTSTKLLREMSILNSPKPIIRIPDNPHFRSDAIARYLDVSLRRVQQIINEIEQKTRGKIRIVPVVKGLYTQKDACRIFKYQGYTVEILENGKNV